jgi:hypothetical protein
MSYHILHQFDEQWFADNGQERDARRNQFFATSEKDEASLAHAARCRRHWMVIIASLVIAASALYFALDARRTAAELRQHVVELERARGK